MGAREKKKRNRLKNYIMKITDCQLNDDFFFIDVININGNIDKQKRMIAIRAYSFFLKAKI